MFFLGASSGLEAGFGDRVFGRIAEFKILAGFSLPDSSISEPDSSAELSSASSGSGAVCAALGVTIDALDYTIRSVSNQQHEHWDGYNMT